MYGAVPRSPRLRGLALPTILLIVGATTACGGDTVAPSPTATTSTAGGFTVSEGTSPQDLLACLQQAGLPAVDKDSTPLGVEVPVHGIEVGPLTGEGTQEQGADLWVFTDPTSAEEHRAEITLSEQDTPTTRVAGNVVVRLFYVPDPSDPQIGALEDCLPS
jgi:hypothetical protein